ncbi:minor extracellular protease vpr [Corchorus capsularis]|uniref:Minor extracellular protease vpr n=1 Tax=Corchorus capsularis TaxID=210143 RepID=A0A1R3I300_COCAP|nr:minor extracellular protease vpr [Corchorus capsularis]
MPLNLNLNLNLNLIDACQPLWDGILLDDTSLAP